MAGHRLADPQDDLDVLLRVEDLVVEYPTDAGTVHAVSGVSLDVRQGETVGVVGESGCGKSTLGRAVTMLSKPTAGTVRFDDTDLGELSQRKLRHLRPRLQTIFQDPVSSLNPRRTVRKIVREGPSIWGREVDDAAVDAAIEAVGLDPDVVGERRAGELSGGQCQRVAIARALMLNPDLIVCDEPVSSLDVSVQAQILNLLEDLRDRYSLTLVFITHDMAVVKHISDRVAVMYLGKLCEVMPAHLLDTAPAHPYTRALSEAIPVVDPDAVLPEMSITGDLPSPLDPPSGCRFRTRCPLAEARCAEEEPRLREIGPGHQVACHFARIEHDQHEMRGARA